MNVKLHTTNTDISGALRYHIERRLRFALSRVGERVGHVSALITGTVGRNVECQLSAEVLPFGRLASQASAPDLMSAIDKAVDKLARLFEKEQDRARVVDRQSIRIAA
jgi:ribosomal subunit interface protein